MPTPTVYVNDPRAPFGPHTTVIKLNRWKVVNAPRPLPGQVTWTGAFRHGIFYAAGPAAEFNATWNALDAWPVEEVTNLEIATRLALKAEEAGFRSLRQAVEESGMTIPELAASYGWPWNPNETLA